MPRNLSALKAKTLLLDRIFTAVARFLRALAVLAVVAGAGVAAAAAANAPRVLAIRFGPDLEINPVTQDWLTHQLTKAAKDGYDAAVVELDTPGGLSSSMKKIVPGRARARRSR